MEQVFEGDHVRPALPEEPGQVGVDDAETFGERGAGRGRDGAAGDEGVAPAVGLDAAVTGAHGPRVDAEDPHASEASISFSSMSAFDQTCCTSSWSSSASMSFTICVASRPVRLT